jgi:hypothetical protein
LINGIAITAEGLEDATGIKFGSLGKDQIGRVGAFTTMTQDQGTKLEGLFTSVQGHVASMDDILKSIAAVMSRTDDRLAQIAENTAYCRRLEDIASDIKEIRRDGLKMK